MLKSYLKLHDATVNHRQCDEFYYTLVDKAEGLPYRSQIRVELHEILSDSPIYHSINKRNYENEDLELFFMKANGKGIKDEIINLEFNNIYKRENNNLLLPQTSTFITSLFDAIDIMPGSKHVHYTNNKDIYTTIASNTLQNYFKISAISLIASAVDIDKLFSIQQSNFAKQN